MSRYVLNDDTVICEDCYDELAENEAWGASSDALIMGSTISLPCRVCGFPDTPREA